MYSSSPTLARFDFGIVAIKSRSAGGMKEYKNTQQMYTQAQTETQQITRTQGQEVMQTEASER